MFLFFRARPLPISTLFPYTTLFRSRGSTVTRGASIDTDVPGRAVTVVTVPSTGAGTECSIFMASTTARVVPRSEEHTSELQSRFDLVCRLLLEKKKKVSSVRDSNTN